MQRILSLNDRELALWNRLPDALRDGWSVRTDNRSFPDTDERRQARCELMRIEDPILVGFRERVATMQDWAEFEKAAGEVPLQSVSAADFLQLFYGLGPAAVGPMIENALSEAQSDDDITMVHALCHIRSVLLDSFLPAYSPLS